MQEFLILRTKLKLRPFGFPIVFHRLLLFLLYVVELVQLCGLLFIVEDRHLTGLIGGFGRRRVTDLEPEMREPLAAPRVEKATHRDTIVATAGSIISAQSYTVIYNTVIVVYNS